MGWFDKAGANDTLTPNMVGPQMDGTNIIADAAVIAQPSDTAGGQPAQYGQDVLDLFKFGIGAWSDNQKTQQLFDYKKFEATNGGLYQQGRAASMPAAASGGISPLVIVGIGAIVVFALLSHKG
jgi:hypothetical protein